MVSSGIIAALIGSSLIDNEVCHFPPKDSLDKDHLPGSFTGWTAVNQQEWHLHGWKFDMYRFNVQLTLSHVYLLNPSSYPLANIY